MPEPRVERPRMPDYGVDDAEWEGLPWEWAAHRLAANKNYWIVTVSADARPHALPAWGVWDETDQQFAFSCGPRSRKAANVAANPQVVITNDDTVECVSVEGRASLVSGARAEVWIARYLSKYAGEAAELSADFLRENLMYEVTPHRAFGIIEREDDFARRATRWRWAPGG